jgi:hypothetical protein
VYDRLYRLSIGNRLSEEKCIISGGCITTITGAYDLNAVAAEKSIGYLESIDDFE